MDDNNHGINIDMKKSKYIKFALCLALGCFFSLGVFAQDTGTGVGDDPNKDVPKIPIPIDGGVSVLIAAGVGYGVKKYRDYRLSKKDIEPRCSE
ncbi:MAG: hypothetical protein J5882_05500 [Bacteroidales bacterium]|nr:hypothetical protein [Bacteroidales bacterium]